MVLIANQHTPPLPNLFFVDCRYLYKLSDILIKDLIYVFHRSQGAVLNEYELCAALQKPQPIKYVSNKIWRAFTQQNMESLHTARKLFLIASLNVALAWSSIGTLNASRHD